ncbi:discoidin domain-containing protein [Endozoicomonas sp. SM1973]|uniref:Discoidin domain-containing protein n=1 Tax=Spartinivicinus marinus TaxID=2994442 RepID=A0A853IFH3_9GAMM|nr:discoidin domain-containing protein [Spartinivicinus marinus]MCX4024716.1 discoidin domain-containing protein [Spartinivicinus marinus]NYZ66256.1 discoidin domain-containing protein [Spartinivicinus marinus]
MARRDGILTSCWAEVVMRQYLRCLYLPFFFQLLLTTSSQATESLCAVVKIEISQELTMERQAFEASMRISNTLDTFALENIKINLSIQDSEGNEVKKTSNASDSNALFYIRLLDSQQRGITNVIKGDQGSITSGIIEKKQTGELKWLIIPTKGAGGEDTTGKVYQISATLEMNYGGKEESIQVSPDTILVKPQPNLVLDYFLTQKVNGDNPFTPAIEPVEPYSLGLRVTNTGAGPAYNVKIKSAQPKIVENKQKLAIGFKILSSYVNNQPEKKSLLLNFGTIDSRSVTTGRWMLETPLTGEFIAFSAKVTHSEDLGGDLTSLIEGTNTHFLLKDVLVDLPGRDNTKDFLAHNNDESLYVYESQYIANSEGLCQNCIQVNALAARLEAERHENKQLIRKLVVTKPTDQSSHIKVNDPYSGEKALLSVVRKDGTRLNPNNYWLSKSIKADNIHFDYYLNIFDVKKVEEYKLYFSETKQLPLAIQDLPDRLGHEGGQIGFIVKATAGSQTNIRLKASQLPIGASFKDKGDGNGVFLWYPKPGQSGLYNVSFEASNDTETASKNTSIIIRPKNDTDGDGLPDKWEKKHFGDLSHTGELDSDQDGYTDFEEYQNQTDPNQKPQVLTKPKLVAPLYGSEITTRSPDLIVENTRHGANEQVSYQFELYQDSEFTQLLAKQESVAEGQGSTVLNISTLIDGQEKLADNSFYYWRAKAVTHNRSSDWAVGKFFINLENDPPASVNITEPANLSVVPTLQPVIKVNNASDVDFDEIRYGFTVYKIINTGQDDNDEITKQKVAEVKGILADKTGTTQWQVPLPLEEDQQYIVVASATDEHQAATHSKPISFVISTINNPPSIPEVISPAKATVIAKKESIQLTAKTSLDPEGQSVTYFIDVDKVDSFDSPSLKQYKLTSEGSTVEQIVNLEDNTLYYWRIKASDGLSHSEWQINNFFVNVVNDPPSVPTPLNPANKAWIEVLTPSLSSHSAADVDGQVTYYEFQLFSDENLTNLVLSQKVTEPMAALTTVLQDNTHYYWRVRAIDEKGLESDWSAISSFFTNHDGVNDKPTLAFTLPEQITADGNQLKLSWQDTDPDSNAQITLFYGENVIIQKNLTEDLDAENDEYQWDISGFEPGQYSIYAEIKDEESSVRVNCCTLIVNPKQGNLIIEPVTDLVTDEFGIKTATVNISLSMPLQEAETVVVNFALSDQAEATILNQQSYLYFDVNNWNTPQAITVMGKDDCDSDGDQAFRLVFDIVASDESLYSETTVEPITFTNQDNEVTEQTLFICDYLKEQIASTETNWKTVRIKPKLRNKGPSLTSVIANAVSRTDLLKIAGNNQVSFSEVISGKQVTSNNWLTVTYQENLNLAAIKWNIQPGESLTEVAGTEDNDHLVGSDNNDYLTGNQGDDILDGGKGNDIILGGQGGDQYIGGEGNDTFIVAGTNAGLDSFIGGEGEDKILGTDADDIIQVNSLTTGSSIEIIDGKAGNNKIFGTDAADEIDLSQTQVKNINTIDGKRGNDLIKGSQGNDNIIGGPGNDLLYGLEGDDSFYVNGINNGFDILDGGTGEDKLIGSAANDVFGIKQITSIEIIDGQAGVNKIIGSTADDELDFSHTQLKNISLIIGGLGNDVIKGSPNNDVIYGGAGYDIIEGNAGDDTFLFKDQDANGDCFDGGEGYDTLIGSEQQDTLYFNSTFARNCQAIKSVEVIDGNGGEDIISGSPSNDKIDLSTIELQSIERIVALAGNDEVIGSSNDDVIDGGDGDDILSGYKGNDLLIGGHGNDTYKHQINDGTTTISESGLDGDNNIIELSGIVKEQVWFNTRNNDLIISILNSHDQIIINDWVTNQTAIKSIKTEHFVLESSSINQLLETMKAIGTPENGSLVLNAEQTQQINELIALTWLSKAGTPELTNLALHATAHSSSNEVSYLHQDLVNDGKADTRWSSAYDDASSIYLDLKQLARIFSVHLNWEVAYGKRYEIQVSNDGQQWRTIYRNNNGKEGLEVLEFTPVIARYVKMQGIKRGTHWGYSLWEFKVFGFNTSTVD